MIDHHLIFQCAAELEEKQQQPQGQSSGSSQLFAKLKQKITKSSKQLREDLVKISTQYQSSIGRVNARQQKYFEQDLPVLLAELEQLEFNRLDQCRQRAVRYAQLLIERDSSQQLLLKEFHDLCAQMNADQDMAEFCDKWIRERGPPIPVQQYSYSLPASPQDIAQGVYSRNPNSIFHCSLEHCMSLQQQSSAFLDIPKILVECEARLRQLGGYESEGIFRLSVSKDDLDLLRQQVDQGNYDFSHIQTPHAIAALMKDWFRNLSEPVIPEANYNAALAIVREAKDEDLSTTHDDINRFVKQLPQLNRLVVQFIAKIVQEVVNPSTRMSVDSCAIVFAPSLLRNPNDDPNLLLQNSKFESLFTAQLFRVLTKS